MWVLLEFWMQARNSEQHAIRISVIVWKTYIQYV